MHERFEKRIKEGLTKLAESCRKARQQPDVIQRRVGGLLGRNTRAASLFEARVERDGGGAAQLRWSRSALWRE